jgi:RNA polymerase sigma-70 factor (sigma-E family)
MAIRRQEDVSAFSEFVSVRSQALYRLAYGVIGDHQLAQDLVQEALIKAYVAWPRLRDRTKVEGYVRRAIVTTAISWRRRRSFHEPPVEHVPETGGSDDPEALVADVVVWAHLRVLPVRQRAAVFLRYHEDLSEAQTAELMGCSVGTVKRQVFMALGKLRDGAGPRADLPDAEGEVAR